MSPRPIRAEDAEILRKTTERADWLINWLNASPENELVRTGELDLPFALLEAGIQIAKGNLIDAIDLARKLRPFLKLKT